MKVKNLFLFGAGASHGCKGVNKVIPLGNNLFNKLRSEFPKTWGNLSNSLRSIFESNFEYGMGKVWDDLNYNENIPYLMKDMAVYFSRFRVIKIKQNLYYCLFKEIQKANILSETILSTINYDCLIELALESLNLRYSYNNQDIIKSDTVNFFKIHGSCNYIPDSEVIKAKSKGVIYKPGTTFNPPLKYLSLNKVEEYCYSDTALYPAMAIYMRGKPIQIGYDTISRIQGNWQSKVKEAKKVFIIGIKPNLEDNHIWDYIHKKDKIFFCGSRSNFREWQNKMNREDVFLSNTFERLISNITKYF